MWPSRSRGRSARFARPSRSPSGSRSLQDIPRGGIIRKYGETIGKASLAISKGALVHIHNLEGTRARGDLAKGGTP